MSRINLIGRSRIGRIEKLQEFNELAGAVAFLDEAMDLPSHEIDPGKKAQRSVALILMISGESCMNAGFRRQVRRGRANRLHARLPVVRDDRLSLAWLSRRGAGRLKDFHLFVNTEDLRHLASNSVSRRSR